MKDINYLTSLRMYRHRYTGEHKAEKLLVFSKNSIGYVKRGSAEFLYRGQVLYAKRGDLIYIPIGTEYYSVWTGEPEIDFYQIEFDFQNKLDASRYSFEIIDGYGEEIFDGMYRDYESAPMRTLGSFYIFLDSLLPRLSIASGALSDDIAPAISYIEENYTRPISVGELAALCNMSESGFYKKFRTALGVTPISYKHNLAIRHSLEFLGSSTLSVEEISDYLGFSSPNYFRRIFFKVMRKSPSAIRPKREKRQG